jgi:adenylosuccinate lyase
MMELVKKGEDRQAVHERIRKKSFSAWESVMRGEPNPLEKLLSGDKEIASRLSRAELRLLMDPSTHTGTAKESCDEFLKKVVSPMLAGHKRARRAKVAY